jgi:hypothetical protein
VLLSYPKAAVAVRQEQSTSTADEAFQFHGQHFVIMTVEDPPFVSVRMDSFNSSSPLLPSEKWHGWIIDLIRQASTLANFTYETVISDGDYSKTMSYGAGYEALIAPGEVLVTGGQGSMMRTVDMFWGTAYIEPARLTNSFMTTPFWYSPLSLVVLHQNTSSASSGILPVLRGFYQGSSDFMQPFALDLWWNILWLLLASGVFYVSELRGFFQPRLI